MQKYALKYKNMKKDTTHMVVAVSLQEGREMKCKNPHSYVWLFYNISYCKQAEH